MGKRKLGALEKIDADLANLQFKIRKDPTLYREEFFRQYEQYEAQRDIFNAAPAPSATSALVSFRDLVDFIAHVADCFPDKTATFFDDLGNILTAHHAKLESELREKIVGSLALLRKKRLIDSERLLLTLFPVLTAATSKSLRMILFQKVVSELRFANAKSQNHRLNRVIQTILFNLVTSDRSSSQGLWAVKLTHELWRRRVWTDSKAVEIMKEASLADNEKVIIGGIRFFLGRDEEMDGVESSDEEDVVDVGKLKHRAGVTKKTKKKARTFEKAVATVKKKERAKNQHQNLNFSALHLLHDPQGFAEVIFSRHLQSSKSRLNLTQKLLVLQLVSRLVGLHKLTLIHLYSYFLKYLTPRQPSVTSFLASLAQSTHNLVPPDVLEPLVQKIANEFVSEAVASEVASAGLSTIREVCARQPLAMTDTLLQDLVMYRKSKDKGVVMAAKGLLGLYREVGPEMLRKRDRGKEATMGLRTGERKERRFGEVDREGIEGLELLEHWKMEEESKKREEKALAGDQNHDGLDEENEVDDEGWEADDDGASSYDSGGWINADSDGQANFSDSDEDKDPPAKKARRGQSDLVVDDESDGQDGEPEIGIGKEAGSSANLATRKILTPADLIKLQELRAQAKVEELMNGSKRRVQLPEKHDPEGPITAMQISSVLPNKNKRDIRSATTTGTGHDPSQAESHKRRSKAAIRHARKVETGKSTTNKEKARRKNMLMTLGKARGKAKRSLVDTQKVLRAHAERAKRGGKRGNR